MNRDNGIQVAILADGLRLHLQHGPIDLILFAEGTRTSVEQAYRQATLRFNSVLQELVDELASLRRPVTVSRTPGTAILKGPIAKRMAASCQLVNVRDGFVTPMAAVAGAVADDILKAMLDNNSLSRASVNNGGDIALHVAAERQFDIGIVAHPQLAEIIATVTIEPASGAGGVATSGRHGRSCSLGIADCVTVLAGSASVADAAATLIANAVDLPDCKQVIRTPAHELDPDSDLTDQPVTVEVQTLSDEDCQHALHNGRELAAQMHTADLIVAAWLSLQGHSRSVGSSQFAGEHQTARWFDSIAATRQHLVECNTDKNNNHPQRRTPRYA